jgi:hypothetical protein
MANSNTCVMYTLANTANTKGCNNIMNGFVTQKANTLAGNVNLSLNNGATVLQFCAVSLQNTGAQSSSPTANGGGINSLNVGEGGGTYLTANGQPQPWVWIYYVLVPPARTVQPNLPRATTFPRIP